ncbi:MAG: prephenate dehydratase [Tissierellaceae bacterium]
MELGYLGPEGSYSHEAAMYYHEGAKLIPMDSFYQIMKSVEEGKIDGGILPIENSTEGAVTSVMDWLLNIDKSKIVGEYILPINHNLVGIGRELKELAYIYSHPQAIEQCRESLRLSMPNAVFIPCESTSLACKLAREKGEAYGAIANGRAKEIYKLNLLKSNIQDNPLNKTRFIVISSKINNSCKSCKTSIAFTFKGDRPGALYEVLREFAIEDINLTRIESRPAKMEIGQYIFFIDLIGNPKDHIVGKVIQRIGDKTGFLKILGTYPLYLEAGAKEGTNMV